MLSIKNLVVSIENKVVINKLNLEIKPGEIHAIMGPNGSGKSSLSSTLVGDKNYKVINGEIKFKNIDLLSMKPEDRAGEGLFLAFQYPIEVPGVINKNFLHYALNSIRKYRNQSYLNSIDFMNFIEKKIHDLKIKNEFLYRAVNVGFSGGEKKYNDILQMIILEPILCILDEIDSGLDIDALKIIAKNINSFHNKDRSFIIITHYRRILDYIKPNYVHILDKGNIIKTGNFSIVEQLEEKGYECIKS